jgi:hypothetical protein
MRSLRFPALRTSLRVLLLTMGIFISYPLAAILTGLSGGASAGGDTSSEALGTVLPLLAVCLVDAVVLTALLLHCRWRGWRLAAAVFVLLFGVETFLSQLETLYFNLSLGLPGGTILRIVGSGAIRALIIAPLAVLITGRWTFPGMAGDAQLSLEGGAEPGWRGLPLRALILATAYVVIYFLFGYFVAWQSEAVRLFYSGSAQLQSFPAHLRDRVLHGSPTLVPFQLLRGGFWASLALLVVRITGGSARRRALLTALLFGGLLSVPCLIPNPYLPAGVRMVHFVELLSSMLLFGALAGWLLSRARLDPANAELSTTDPTGR